MILSITTFTSQAELREFTCMLTALSNPIAIIRQIISHGDHLLNGHVIIDNQRIDLPTDPFNYGDSEHLLAELKVACQLAVLRSHALPN